MQYLKSLIVVLCGLLVSADVTAQLTQPSTALPTLPVTTDPSQKLFSGMDMQSLITDGAVDPDEYRLGPGDLLQLRLWTAPEPQMLMVSVDQKLVVPRIGVFDTKNKTLSQITGEVLQKIDASFRQKQAEASLSLVNPRKIYVTVKGQVERPGVLPLTAATRAGLAVELSNTKEEEQLIFADQSRLREIDRQKREADRIRPYFGVSAEQLHSERHILVSHADGTSDRVDLVRFNATRDPRFCPLLREGDVIYVPYKSGTGGLIAIYGAVRAPGEIEFVEGDSLVGMIQNAFGATQTADLTRVELTRMSANGESFVTSIHNVAGVHPGSAQDIPLQRGDRIFIRENADVRPLSKVAIKGEVAQPGVYPITRLNTTLSEVVQQAGGLTPYAHLQGAYISRKLQSELDGVTGEEESLRLWRLSNLNVEDTVNFRIQTQVREGDVKVDMVRLFKEGDKSADVTLRDGDVIVIPTTPNTVYVWGYVGRMGHIPYQPGAPLSYYVKAAGGYAEGAVESKTRVIKARTRQWMEPDDTVIEPGDEIYAQKEGDYPEDYDLRIWGSIAGIIGGLSLVIFGIIDRSSR